MADYHLRQLASLEDAAEDGLSEQDGKSSTSDYAYTLDACSKGTKRSLQDQDTPPTSRSSELQSPAAKVAKIQPEDRFNDLPLVLKVPSHGESTAIKLVEELPETVREKLKNLHLEFRTAFETRIRHFNKVCSNPASAMEQNFCVRERCTRGKKITRNGKLLPPQSFSYGGRFRVNADAKCIKMKQPCLHMMQHEGEYALCVVPLPPAMRAGRNWKELGFWVQE